MESTPRRNVAVLLAVFWAASLFFNYVIDPIIRLNVERLAEQQGWDRWLADRPYVEWPISMIWWLLEHLLDIAGYVASTEGIAFVAGALFVAFLDPLLWPFRWARARVKAHRSAKAKRRRELYVASRIDALVVDVRTHLRLHPFPSYMMPAGSEDHPTQRRRWEEHQRVVMETTDNYTTVMTEKFGARTKHVIHELKELDIVPDDQLVDLEWKIVRAYHAAEGIAELEAIARMLREDA